MALEKAKNTLCESAFCENELLFLIAKYLSKGKFQNTFEIFKGELEANKVIPNRIDWLGDEHERSFQEFESFNSHVQQDTLLQLLHRLIPAVQQICPTYPSSKSSLLGLGFQSLLRVERSARRTYQSVGDLIPRPKGSLRLESHDGYRRTPNRTMSIVGREMVGYANGRHFTTNDHFARIELFTRNVGHLSAIYCALLDKTGRYIITGADDTLVKIWSVRDGRLVFTLRGASAEISDLAIDPENVLLAAGSCDKVIRVWNLQTFAPVAVLTSHTGMITALQFCPMAGPERLLISTGGDGCVAFWTYRETDNGSIVFDRKPLKFNEKVRPGHGQLICASFSSGGRFLSIGGADHFVRIYHLSPTDGVEKLIETEIHTDRVDSIQWCHSGVRLVSGSRDGTALIWYYESQEWRTIALKMTDTLPQINVPEDKTKRLQVTMVGWDRSDRWVITASSDHLIRVWESNSGNLIRVLQGHEDNVYVIEAHPTESRLILTAGHDGMLFIWDIECGTTVMSFKNTIEGQGHGALFDAKWDRDGMAISATDSHGHILIFGIGHNEMFKKIPQEMFFHTDYRPLVRDANHHVLDEQTQLAPHLMPPPFLVNIDGNPYPPEYQRLVPGRECCLEDQLIPNVITDDNGEQEVLDFSLADVVPPPLGSGTLGHGSSENPEPVSGSGQRRTSTSSDLNSPGTAGTSSSQSMGPGWIDQNNLAVVGPQSRRTIDEMIEQLALRQERDRRILTRDDADIETGSISGGPSRQVLESSNPDHSYSSASAPRPQGSLSSPRSGRVGTRREGDIEGVRQSTGDWERDPHIKWKRRIYIPRLSPGSIAKSRDNRESRGELEWTLFSEQDRKGMPSPEVFKVEDHGLGFRRAKRGPKSHAYSTRANPEDTKFSALKSPRGRLKGTTQGPRKRKNGDANRSQNSTGDHNEEIDDQVEEENSESSQSSTSYSSSSEEESDSSSEYSDWTANVTKSSAGPSTSSGAKTSTSRLAPPKRTAHKQRKISFQRRITKVIKSDSDSDGSAPTSPQRRTPKPVVKADPESEASQSPAEGSVSTERRSQRNAKKKKDVAKPYFSLRSRRREGIRFVNMAESDLDEGGEIPPAYRIPDWLSETVPKKAPYFPQMGDELVYLTQGHKLYVAAVISRGKYSLDQRTLPWVKKEDLRDEEHVKIVGIKYEIYPPRLCCLKLCLMEGSDLTDESFTVKYHDMEDVLDFLVLKTTYDAAVSRQWIKGDEFRCIIDDAWWVGTVEGLEPYEDESPDSSFLCYQVIWDNGEKERLSPWDMEPIVEGATVPYGGGSVRVKPEEYKALVYTPSSEEWSGQSFEIECQRIASGIGKIMELSAAEPFLAPVDLNVYPNYAMVVAYPIDLSTIKSRLESHFYRRPNAAQFDVRYIATNAELFNKGGSTIVNNGRVVTELALRLIRSPDCIDPTIHYHEVLEQIQSEQPEEGVEGASKKTSDGALVPKTRGRRKGAASVHSKFRNSGSEPSKTWQEMCKDLLRSMFERQDSCPFRHPVNLERYRDYDRIIDIPMDLTTIREEIAAGGYDAPEEFSRDVRLVFSNSKMYNTNSKSKIYSMTLRLEAFFDDQFKTISAQYKNSKVVDGSKRRLNKAARSSHSTSRNLRTRPNNHNQRRNESSPSSPKSQPSKSGGKRFLVKNSRNKTVSEDSFHSRTASVDTNPDNGNGEGTSRQSSRDNSEEWGPVRRSGRTRNNPVSDQDNEDKFEHNRIFNLRRNHLVEATDSSNDSTESVRRAPRRNPRSHNTQSPLKSTGQSNLTSNQIKSDTKKSPIRPKHKEESSNQSDSDEPNQSDSEEEEEAIPKTRNVPLGRRSKRQLEDSADSEDETCPRRVRESKLKITKQTRHKTLSRRFEEYSEDEEQVQTRRSSRISRKSEDRVVKKSPRTPTKTAGTKDFSYLLDEDSESVEEPLKHKTQRKSPNKRNQNISEESSSDEDFTPNSKRKTLQKKRSKKVLSSRGTPKLKRPRQSTDDEESDAMSDNSKRRRNTRDVQINSNSSAESSEDDSDDVSSQSGETRKKRKILSEESDFEQKETSNSSPSKTKTRSLQKNRESEFELDEEEDSESDEDYSKKLRKPYRKSKQKTRLRKSRGSESEGSWESRTFIDDSSCSTEDSEVLALQKQKERKMQKVNESRRKAAREKTKATEMEKTRKAREREKIKKIRQKEREKARKIAEKKSKKFIDKALKERNEIEDKATRRKNRKISQSKKSVTNQQGMISPRTGSQALQSPVNQGYYGSQFNQRSPQPVIQNYQAYYQPNMNMNFPPEYYGQPSMAQFDSQVGHYPIQNGAISTTTSTNPQNHTIQDQSLQDLQEEEIVGKTGRVRRKVRYNEDSDEAQNNVSSRGRLRRVNTKMRDYI